MANQGDSHGTLLAPHPMPSPCMQGIAPLSADPLRKEPYKPHMATQAVSPLIMII